MAGELDAISLRHPLAASGGGSGDSLVADLSADGQRIVFLSTAPNLVPDLSTGGIFNVYVRDQAAAVTRLVSVNREGTGGGSGHSTGARISADGRYVVFESAAHDLVTSDGNDASDIFRHDLETGHTELISVNLAGVSGNGASWWPVMTPDGTRIAFVSAANDLVPGDNNGIPDVFVRDLTEPSTSLVSVGATPGTHPFAGCEAPQITPDGRYVAFVAYADDVLAGIKAGQGTVFVRDRTTETTFWVAANLTELTGVSLAQARAYNPVLSDDGRVVAYKAQSGASGQGWLLRHQLDSGVTEVVASDAVVEGAPVEDLSGPSMKSDGGALVYAARDAATAPSQIFHWDAATGVTTLVSVNVAGTGPANGISDTPRISADGRYVTFLSHATDLVDLAVPGSSQWYERDLVNGTTRLLSLNAGGEAALSDLVLPGLSADGGQAVVDASDDRYVAGDGNHCFDVFGTGLAFSGWDLLSAVFPGGESATGSGASGLDGASLSADGRYVVFTSLATDLVPNDHNRSSDVFVRDLHTGQTLLVSVNRDGTGSGNGPSTAPAISANGRFVAFESSASDLVPGDQNGRPDVFIRDLELGQTWLISVNLGGTASGTRGATSPAISADGSAVAFLSDSPDLIAGEAPRAGRPRVFVRDRVEGVTRPAGIDREEWNSVWGCDELLLAADGQSVIFRWLNSPARLLRTDLVTGVTERVDASMAGASDSPRPISTSATLSADARYVTFVSGHPFLVPDDRNLKDDVFLRDLLTGQTRLITMNTNGVSGNGHATEAVISADGRWVAFVSQAGDLVPNDPLRHPDAPVLGQPWPIDSDVFLHELETGMTLLVSRSAREDRSANDRSDQVAISGDGRWVAYRSLATDLVAGDDKAGKDIFVYDRFTGLNTLASVSARRQGPGDRSSHQPRLSSEGGVLVFKSSADDFIPFDYNHAADLFWRSVDAPGRMTSLVARVDLTGTGAPTLSWRAAPEAVVRVEYRDRLTEGSWQPLPATAQFESGWMRLIDPLPVAATERYYRIVLANP
jgi:Tol biopolymer transport system component